MSIDHPTDHPENGTPTAAADVRRFGLTYGPKAKPRWWLFERFGRWWDQLVR